MGTLFHQLRIADLAGLQDLTRNTAVCLANQERTAAGFAGVLHYAAYTDRPVQSRTLFVAQVRILQCLKDTLLLRH